jgi:glycosyltransferase involved in cell wall biosynthesis
MQPKKILHIITKGSPYGGAQKYVFDIATGLSRDTFESVVLIGHGDELPQKLTDKDIRIIRIPEMKRDIDIWNEIRSFWFLIQTLRKEKPDIIHLNSSKAAGLGALAGRLTGIKRIVFTAHGWAFNEPRPKSSIVAIKFLSWLTVMLAHHTIVIAKSEYSQALDMPFTKSKITLIYNGISPIPFVSKSEAREVLSQKLHYTIDKSVIWIGTIAELTKNKNISACITAFNEINEKAILVIIGDGEERPNLEEQIDAMKLHRKIFLMGKIPDASTLMKAFDIFALPSLKEGLPYTLLEAGLAGLPCLSTYVGGIPEIIRNNISGVLVEPHAPDIARGLEILMVDPTQSTQFGDALKEKVLRDFSLERMLVNTVAVYQRQV